MSRLLLRLCLAMLAVLAASSFVVRWGGQRSAQMFFQDEVPRLVGDIELARRRLEAVPVGQTQRELERLRRQVPVPLSLLEARSGDLDPKVRRQLLSGRPLVFFTHRGYRSIYVPIRGGRQVLVLGPVRPGPGQFPVVTVALAILGIVMTAGLLVASPLVRRMRRLERAAERISDGDLSARTEDNGRDAIGSLARRFNRMADRVQQLLEDQRRLMQAVSHELRTPIARIRFGLELLVETPEGDKRQARQEALEADLDELEQLIEELLFYIRVGSRALELKFEAALVVPELRALIDRLVEFRPQVQASIEAASPDDQETRVDVRHFRRAMGNLMTNALRYAASRVVLSVRKAPDGRSVEIEVSDDGPGIPEPDRERIFEPFTRLDESRNRGSGGVGLGLAITRRIVEAHGGRIHVGRSSLGGASFVVVWPGADAGADTGGYNVRRNAYRPEGLGEPD